MQNVRNELLGNHYKGIMVEHGGAHYRIDYLKDIAILEQNVDMIFGGINPDQYAERYIYQTEKMWSDTT